MANEAINGAPATSAVEKKDTNNSTAPDAPVATALNGDAPKEASATPAEAAESSSAEQQADSSKGAGNKHERDDATAALVEKENPEPAGEPAAKKQKTDTEPAQATNGTEVTAVANVQKKRRPGRPRRWGGNGKAEKKAPRPRATEGIGSRTRSRVQA
ncbi:uncharacterized protein PADG_00674 [Paracoccidioides brasiliensis Pb18]|uniref:Uncharacterized protein n=1 Tax=Paracoccidioides brasiliensis (strain Pb18) TaxID=502780 RepID=C1G1D4_PARBD|nr:uncharacterized protein PADG_00674 [Paracoccidioides brasiliensis Pb18]EEH44385.1 hypothetical protein PADG_00674 [Paracoccidioides brasiliensis Pb18]ODH53550.1 hypothetical protein GX48_00383 [Paracoccidioides brasiliensis]